MKKLVFFIALLSSISFNAQTVKESIEELNSIRTNLGGKYVSIINEIGGKVASFSVNSSNNRKKKGAKEVKELTLLLIYKLNADIEKADRLDTFFYYKDMKRPSRVASIISSGLTSIKSSSKSLVYLCNLLIKRPKVHRKIRDNYNSIITKKKKLSKDLKDFLN